MSRQVYIIEYSCRKGLEFAFYILKTTLYPQFDFDWSSITCLIHRRNFRWIATSCKIPTHLSVRCFSMLNGVKKRHSSYIVRILAQCLLIINQPVPFISGKQVGPQFLTVLGSHHSPKLPQVELNHVRYGAKKIWAFSFVHSIWPRILNHVHRTFDLLHLIR